MSGDVQPRKRKDKRKKREEDDSSSHGVHITKMGNEDVHLHVQHQHGTGGHWCAKIIFFALMAVLLGLVGLIIMENRGLEDLDTPLSESRYSNYFDGWVEEHRQEEHDEHDQHGTQAAALEDHDDEDHDEEEEEEYEQHSVEEAEEDEHEVEEEAQEEEEEEEEDNNAAENLTAEEEEEENDEDNDEIEESVPQSAADDEIDEEEEQEDEAEANNDNEDEDEDIEESIEPTISQSQAQSAPETAEEEDDLAEENEDEEEDEEQLEESNEPAISQSQPQTTAEDENDEEDEENNDNADDFDDDDDDVVEEDVATNEEDDFEQDNDEDDFESLDQDLRDEEAQQKDKEPEEKAEEEAPAATTASWLGSLAVKFGVGIALALVSRLVLIRKNPNTNEEEQAPDPETNMRRRLTIATAEDNIPDDVEELPPLDDEEYSEEEIEIEEEIEVEISDLEESDDNIAINASYVPETFEQLSAMYRSKMEPKLEPKTERKTVVVTPEPEPEPEPEHEHETEPEAEAEAETTAASDIYVEYEDGDIEDYEHDESDEEDISDEEEDEISDVDDAELMSRLEAKYGRLPAKEYESDPDSDDPSWTQIKPKNPTGAKSADNVDIDDLFEQELRQANAEMINENSANALRAFNTLTHTHAHKPRAHLFRARALERVAEQRRSNQLLLESIESYKRYLAFDDLIVDNDEFRAAGEQVIQHLRFLGYTQQTWAIHELLIARFPQEAQPRNQLSLSHLMSNNLAEMQLVAAETLKRFPQDAVAQLHFGLAIKQLTGDYKGALPYLQYAIDSKQNGTQEPYFYVALGETLQRLGRQKEAWQLHQLAAQKKYFPSVYQRSLYNVKGLRAKPFWQLKETGIFLELRKLQHNFLAIKKEALSLLNKRGNFQPEAEQLRDTGNWQQYELFSQGKIKQKNCEKASVTCALLAKLPSVTNCRRGQVKFSAMRAKTHVWPHCGPTNCRLRAHLTLLAPEPHLTSLRVAEEQRTWHEGDLFVFDDSFEHEVWHNGTQLRLVLIVDFWHPDLNESQRRNLTPI